MSAWLCSDGQISAIVQGMVQWHVIGLHSAQTIGQSLVDENYHSLASRYHDSDTPHQFVRTLIEAPLDPIKVHMTTSSYRYQACEHGGWNTSAACQLTGELLAVIESRLGMDHDAVTDLWPDDDSTWAITDIKECLP